MDAVYAAASQPWVMAAVTLIVAMGAIVQAGLGMGYAVIAAPLLALIAPDLVPVPTLWMGFATSAYGAWSDRRGVIWSEVGVGLTGRVVGIALALLVLDWIGGGAMFSLVFGLMVGLAVVLSLGGWRLEFNRVSLVGMAAVSGLMATISSVGAPPLAMIYQSRPSAAARPTLAAFFAIGVAMSLAALHATGHAGWREIWLAGMMVPPMVVGTIIGRRMRGRFDNRYRPFLLGISGAAAVILILRGLLWNY